MPDLTLKVLKRVRVAGPGAAFTPKAFGDLVNRAAVDQALSRLTKAGKIRRISRGVYDVPRHHPTLGPLSPDPDAVARAIADQSGYRLQPTPARAANALGRPSVRRALTAISAAGLLALAVVVLVSSPR